MLFWIFLSLAVILFIGLPIWFGYDGDPDGVGAGLGIAFCISFLLAIVIGFMGAAHSDNYNSAKTNTKALVSFAEYSGGEAGGPYLSVDSAEGEISYVVDGKIVQVEEDYAEIFSSDRNEVELIHKSSKHEWLMPWVIGSTDVTKFYVSPDSVDYVAPSE